MLAVQFRVHKVPGFIENQGYRVYCEVRTEYSSRLFYDTVLQTGNPSGGRQTVRKLEPGRLKVFIGGKIIIK